MGINHNNFIAEVCAILANQCQHFDPERDITIKTSNKGKYLSITATISTDSKEHLDNIYLTLNKHAMVKVTL